MTIYRPLLGLCISLTALQSACSPSIEPAFEIEQRYKHDLYSPDECVRIRQSNVEFNCSETVQFRPNGVAYLLLGGGDIVVQSKYQRKRRKITVQPSIGLPNEVVFKIVTDGVLVRVGSNTRWVKY